MIVAFDPGRNVGVAFVDASGRLLRHEIVTLASVDRLELPAGAVVVVGGGTGGRVLRERLEALGHTVETAAEEGTSLEARTLYFRDHPPRGWARLLPEGMRSPPVPIDDYAAYAIALRWLAGRR